MILGLLAVDRALAAVQPAHAVGFKEATAWSLFCVAVALAVSSSTRSPGE